MLNGNQTKTSTCYCQSVASSLKSVISRADVQSSFLCHQNFSVEISFICAFLKSFLLQSLCWGFLLQLRPPKYWDFWQLYAHSRTLTLLILCRLMERQGRTAVSQQDTLIFISHAAGIWEHLSEALRAARILIYSRNCFIRQVAFLAKFRTIS